MNNFQPGQRVIWIRDSWYGTYRIPATVVKINKKTVTIDANLANGDTKRRNVSPDNLEVKS